MTGPTDSGDDAHPGEHPYAGEDLAARLADLVHLVASAVRWAAREAGLTEADAEERVASTLAYLRRALRGEIDLDSYGSDAEFVEFVYLPVLRVLYRRWFRIEVRGIENIPEAGGALVVANHAGTIPLDALMTQVAVHDEHPARRRLRVLGADLVFATPVLGELVRRGGGTLATPADATRLLSEGEVVGVWPEGFKGIGKRFSERYRLQRFGRGGFVATALRTGTPIVPCSIVGAEETYPMLADLEPLADLLGLPYFPLTPTFPHLGLLGVVPLPSTWIIDFGAPVDTSGLRPTDADDPLCVLDLSDRVRERIQRRLHVLLAERGPAFGR